MFTFSCLPRTGPRYSGQERIRHNSLRSAFGSYSVSFWTSVLRSEEGLYHFSARKVFLKKTTLRSLGGVTGEMETSEPFVSLGNLAIQQSRKQTRQLLFGWQKIVCGDSKRFGDDGQFEIEDRTDSRLDFPDCGSVQRQSGQLQFRGELILGQILRDPDFPNLRSN